jgi:hypothetical protein
MSKAKKILSGIAVIIALVLGWMFFHYGLSCVAGGGGSEHIPPSVTSGPIELNLLLSRWAAPQCLTGKTSEHFSEVKCHYRMQGERAYEALSMQMIQEEKNRAFYRCTIPKLAGVSTIEYFFDFKMDGTYNKRNEKPLAIK